MSQSAVLDRDLLPESIAPTRLYLHIVTLIHRATWQEVSFEVETTSIRFKDVLDAITWQKVERKLFGYEIYEVLDCNDPF